MKPLTSFKRAPIQLAGPTSKNRSAFLSSELTQNFYIEVDKPGSILQPFPGCKTFHTNTNVAQPDRGCTVFKDELYKLSGDKFYKVDSAGVAQDLGNIPGTDPVVFATDGIDLFIATGSTPYIYNTTLAAIADADFENPSTAAFLNGQVIVDGATNRFGVTDVLNIQSIDALNYETANAVPGDLKRVYVFEDFIYFFCDENTERWYNSGEGNPPIDRLDGASIKVGIDAPYSVSNTETFIYFLADDLRVYRLRNSVEENVTTISVSQQIEGFETTNDARGFCFNWQGQNFYFLTFPTANKTFLYSETFNQWVNLSFGLAGGRHLANSYAFCYGKHLVTDYRNGSVYELDKDTFTDAGELIQRIRVLPNLTGDLIDAPGQRLLINKIELVIERGNGNADERKPQIVVEFSGDAGRSWKSLNFINVGQAGQFLTKVDYNLMESFYEGTFRITATDPNYFTLKAATVFVKNYGY